MYDRELWVNESLRRGRRNHISNYLLRIWHEPTLVNWHEYSIGLGRKRTDLSHCGAIDDSLILHMLWTM